MRNKQKTPADVMGVQINCPNYEMCPLCYGCRAYNPSYVKCLNRCGQNEKFHTCDTKKHRADLLARMITREKIVVTSSKPQAEVNLQEVAEAIQDSPEQCMEFLREKMCTALGISEELLGNTETGGTEE